MKRAKTIALASAVLLAVAVMLAGCGSPEPEEETAYITISLGGGAGRAAVPWDAGLSAESIPHDIIIDGALIASGVKIGGGAVFKHAVTPGEHSVEVRGYDPASTAKLVSYAEATATVALGENKSCPIQLRQAFETSVTPWADAVNAIKVGGNPDRIYYIIANTDFSLAGSTDYSATFGPAAGIAVNIRGTGKISLAPDTKGSLLIIGPDQTVSLKGARLEGHSTNDRSLVHLTYTYLKGDGSYDYTNPTSGTFKMAGGTISGNNGGGVCVVYGTFDMSGGTISGNTTGGTGGDTVGDNGGGVDIEYGTFNMSGGTITGNKARDGGGVNVSSGTFNMSGGLIAGNESTGSYEYSYYGGGGVSVRGVGNIKATFNMSGTAEIRGNKAACSGGGVALKVAANYAIVEFNMSGGTIAGNESGTGYFGGGGGVGMGLYSISTSDGTRIMNMTGGTISGNKAGVSGGGVYYIDTMEGGTITDNESIGDGGGVAGIATMTGGTISGNRAGGSGGGVYIYSEEDEATITFNMSGGTISDNNATSGGGVYVGTYFNNEYDYYTGPTLTINIKGGTISDNTAADGGGVYVYAQGTGGTPSNYARTNFTMTSGTISGNKATTGSGGGVYVYGNGNRATSTFTMSDGNIAGSEAADKGGGVYVVGTTATRGVFNLNQPAGKTKEEMLVSNTAKGGAGSGDQVYVATGQFKIDGAVQTADTGYDW